MSVSALQTNVKIALAEIKTKHDKPGRQDLDKTIQEFANALKLNKLVTFYILTMKRKKSLLQLSLMYLN